MNDTTTNREQPDNNQSLSPRSWASKDLDKLGRPKGGRPLSPKLQDIDIEKLPTKFQTAEQLRGYVLAQTDGGRQVVDTILADFRSRKSNKTIKRDLAKMLLELITPEKGQKLEFGFDSPDGKFGFRWQNEVVEEEDD